MRTPTEQQASRLMPIAGGAAGLSWTKRQTEPLVKHGWVTADFDGSYYQWVRITPDGLRALAAAVERDGLPDLRHGSLSNRVRVCSNCGSTRYRIESREVEAPA